VLTMSHELDRKCWRIDGARITKPMLRCWSALDWSTASVDMGPSPAGNEGPYFHVECAFHGAVHRLYPRTIQLEAP